VLKNIFTYLNHLSEKLKGGKVEKQNIYQDYRQQGIFKNEAHKPKHRLQKGQFLKSEKSKKRKKK